jgi:two-component system, sensor histidine kinase and response regulator
LHESNIFKDKLFSIISHDLRAPLAQVQSVLELLVNELLDLEEFREILPNLLQNTKTTMSFLDNLLLWAKSQIQGQNMDKQYFNITDLIQKNIALFQQGAINKNILLAGSYQSYQVFADKNMIDLVVRNLLNNAIKFCQEGDKIMVYSLPDENMLKICVEDTGVGISPENLNKLLNKEVFSQKGTSGEAGTGLGLKLCQDFVEKNGGKMWIESELGKGSKFFFSVQISSIIQEKATS